MTEFATLQINLNPNGVATPTHRAVIISTQVVATCLNAIAAEDFVDSTLMGGFMGYKFEDPEMNGSERSEAYKNWILSKGFQDLARGVRETLEEAFFFIEIIKSISEITDLANFEMINSKIRRDASKMTFTQILKKVNRGLIEPSSFVEEFTSLQKARNCLEHRGGIVSPHEVDQVTNNLTLKFPRLRIFYRSGEKEIEIKPGEVIDTHSPDNPFGEDEKVSIYMDRTTRTREFAIGESLVISISDFVEIALACQMFASQLAQKLPKPEASVPQ